MDEPRFTQTHRPFSMDCAVEITIRAIADVLWSLLLKARTDGSTDFAMTERFSGLMLPLIKASLP